MVGVPPHCVPLDGEIQGARCFWNQHVKFLTRKSRSKHENVEIWSAVRDAGLKFCQNEAVLGRIILEVMETHKKALKHQKM